MATNSSTKKVVSKKLLKIINTKVQTSTLIDEQIGLENVLNVTCKPAVVSCEMLGEYLQINGKVEYDICYLSTNKTFESTTEVADFNERLQLGVYENVYSIPVVRNIQFKKSGNNLIDIVGNIELQIFGVLMDEIYPISPGNDNLIERTINIITQTLSSSASERFEVCEDIEVSDNVEKVIVSLCKLTNYKIVPYDNYAKVEGAYDLDVTYLSNDTIKHLVKTIDFIQEVAVLNLKPTDLLDESLVIDSFNIVPNILDNQNKTVLTIKNVMSLNLLAYLQEENEVLIDAFSTKKQLTISTESFANSKFIKNSNMSEQLKVSVDMKEKKRMDEILFIGSPILNVVQSTIEADSILFSATISQNVVFKNYDTEDVNTAKLEIPVTSNLMVQEIGQNTEVFYSIKVNNYKNKAGKEIDFNYELYYEIRNDEKKYDCFISKIEDANDLPVNENSVIIYMPNETDDLYTIAKDLKISPDVILAQNPNFTEAQVNKKIVVYLQKK